MMLRFLSLSSGLKENIHSLTQKKATPFPLHMSVNLDVFLKDTWIYCQQKKKKKSSGVFFHGVASRGRGSSPALLRAQGWRSKVTVWPDSNWTTSYPDHISIHSSSVAPSFSKQAVFTQTATSQADRRAHVVIRGRMRCQEACKDPLSVMSLDQLHCECLWGTRSS